MSYFSSPVPAVMPTASRAAVAVTGAPGALFTVAGGRVIVRALFATVTTVVGAVATTLQVRANPTTGVDTDLCVAAAVTSAPVGSLFTLTGIVTDALSVVAATQGGATSMTAPVIIQPGTIDLVVAGGTTGACTWFCQWDPVDAGATLV